MRPADLPRGLVLAAGLLLLVGCSSPYAGNENLTETEFELASKYAADQPTGGAETDGSGPSLALGRDLLQLYDMTPTLGTPRSKGSPLQAQIIPVAGGPPQPALSNRLMIFTVDMTVRVENFQTALTSAQQIAKQVGGFVESSDISKQPDRPNQASFTLRIPADKLEDAIQLAHKLGRVLEEKRDSEDVTAQVVDIEARLKNLRASESNLRRLMAGSRKMADTLQIERRLTEVRGEIESIEARYRTLKDQIALSTLRLTLLEPDVLFKPADAPWSAAFHARQAWQQVVLVTQGLGILGIYVGVMSPLWLPFVLLPLGYWLWSRRRRARLSKV